MTDTQGAEGVKALSDLVEESFPGIRCLRCGNEDFYILPFAAQSLLVGDEARIRSFPVITLSCARCGMIEQHMAETLQQARKPIDQKSSDNAE